MQLKKVLGSGNEHKAGNGDEIVPDDPSALIRRAEAYAADIKADRVKGLAQIRKEMKDW